MQNVNFDPYAVLGLQKNANINQIKTAFMNLSRTTHPDRGGNPELFKVIRGSYDYLVKLHTLSSTQQSFYHPMSNDKNEAKSYDVNERAQNLSRQYVPIPQKQNNQPQNIQQQSAQQQNQMNYQQQSAQQQNQINYPQQKREQTNNRLFNTLERPQFTRLQSQDNQHDVKKQFNNYLEERSNNNSEIRSRPSQNNYQSTNSSIDVDKFNKAFNESKVRTVHDHGYGEMMDKSSNSRQDVDVLAKSSGNQFKNQLIVYKKPQEIESVSGNYERLGQSKIDDYSSSINEKGLSYSDYRIAMSNAEKPTGKIENRSFEKFQTERKKEIPKMSEEEIKQENEEKRKAEIEEMNRQYRQHQLDQQIFRNYQDNQSKFNGIRK